MSIQRPKPASKPDTTKRVSREESLRREVVRQRGEIRELRKALDISEALVEREQNMLKAVESALGNFAVTLVLHNQNSTKGKTK